MNNFLKLKAIIDEHRSFPQFREKLKRSNSIDQYFMSLLLMEVILTKNHYFQEYLDIFIQYRLRYIYRMNININQTIKLDNKTILMIACQKGTADIVQKLINVKGIDPYLHDINNMTAIFHAMKNQSLDESIKIVSYLLEKFPQLILSVANNNQNVLFLAIERGSYEIVQLLIQKEVKLHICLKDNGNTPLHEAIYFYKQNNSVNAKKIVFKLVENGAEMNILNLKKQTPIDLYPEFKDELDSFIKTLEEVQYMYQINSEADIEKIRIQAKRIYYINYFLCPDFHLNVQSQQQSQNSQCSQFSQEIDIKRIDAELWQFNICCENKHAIVWEQIKPFYLILTELAQSFQMIIEIIGSFATGLWSDTSDIDFIMIPQYERQMHIQSTIDKIYNKFKHYKQQFEIFEINLNRNNNFPIIKLTMNDVYNFRKIDVAIFHKNSNGKKYVLNTLSILNTYPFIKPIFLFLKRVAEVFDLHDQKKGGLKTYALFLLIYNVVKSCQFETLTQGLKNVAYYYGFYYNYNYEYNQQGQIFMKLNLIDPFNVNNNVGGKKTKVLQIKNMFRIIYYSIFRHQPLLQYLQQMQKIF